jgi:hypothetical protein
MLVHSIIFNKKKWTIPSSQKWVYDHGYKPIKNVDVTENYYRWRIRDPKLFKQFVIKDVGNSTTGIACKSGNGCRESTTGIKFVFGIH